MVQFSAVWKHFRLYTFRLIANHPDDIIFEWRRRSFWFRYNSAVAIFSILAEKQLQTHGRQQTNQCQVEVDAVRTYVCQKKVFNLLSNVKKTWTWLGPQSELSGVQTPSFLSYEFSLNRAQHHLHVSAKSVSEAQSACPSQHGGFSVFFWGFFVLARESVWRELFGSCWVVALMRWGWKASVLDQHNISVFQYKVESTVAWV